MNAFKPKVGCPYHYGDSDLNAFKEAVTDPGIQVRILDWY